ncbi:methylmalonyl-CoA mutase [Thermoplasmatales archaeon SW_10_69_26]|nr:MAG: methylmalonyl-CoA mutase [Thermoplasmatales archaeon SW_10_69_26]
MSDDSPELGSAREAWEEAYEQQGERDALFETTSGKEVPPLRGPTDQEGFDPDGKLSQPGEYPFTRGPYETMYRGRLWTMRQFAGFGTPEETNERYHYLLENGQTGLSVAFDMPTLYGYDSDSEYALGEVGKCGVAIDSLADMETLFEGIPLDEVSTSMTINAPAPMLWAMYLAIAEKQDVPFEELRGTIQNDMLKEFIAQKEWVMGPEPSMKVVTDTIEYAVENTPKWNVLSISGYHIREAGSTAAQELAFTLADGMEYARWAADRGLEPDEFLPQFSFFFNAHNDLFEEVAKYRAARRIWADFTRNELGAENPRSWKLKFHTQTAGCSLTAQQPLNNIVRTTVQALAGVLGGTQSLHTNSYDEALALPSEQAARVALRTQQIIAHESGVANTIDPLGGSYYVEWLTDELEEEARSYFDEIEAQGGLIPAVEKGFFQREIAQASHTYQQQTDEGDRKIVGVNAFTEGNDEDDIEVLHIDAEQARERQNKRIEEVKADRDEKEVTDALHAFEAACKEGENQMPYILDCVKAYATVGEMCEVWRRVYGEYREDAVI